MVLEHSPQATSSTAAGILPTCQTWTCRVVVLRHFKSNLNDRESHRNDVKNIYAHLASGQVQFQSPMCSETHRWLQDRFTIAANEWGQIDLIGQRGNKQNLCAQRTETTKRRAMMTSEPNQMYLFRQKGELKRKSATNLVILEKS